MRHRSVPWNQRQSPLSRGEGGRRKEQPQIGDAPASQKAVLCARGTGPSASAKERPRRQSWVVVLSGLPRGEADALRPGRGSVLVSPTR